MPLEELENRLASIEARLNRIESKLALPPLKSAAAKASEPDITAAPTPLPVSRRASESLSISTLLGWSGATALVMAAVYLIRLALDAGWLTPERQIAMAIAGGLALIGAGLALRHANRSYAALLPAGGIVTLFISVYGAHMYYGLIGPEVATAGVMLVCVLSLWLCVVFASEMYALFAVLGSYSAPFLIDNVLVDVIDLAIYFSAWSLLFSLYAIRIGQRLVYLLALYCALLGFDALFRISMASEWQSALLFQTVQFAIFAFATAAYSVRHAAPMTREVAAMHLPALLIFYFLQYALLKQNLPEYAPWIAMLTAVAVALMYLATRRLMHQALAGGRFLLSVYVALVLFHAGYLEMLPDEWAPWAAFVLAPAVAWFSGTRFAGAGVGWPVWLGVGIVTAVNYLRVISDSGLSNVPANEALAVCYALELYLAYWMVRNRPHIPSLHIPLLYAGHISAMAAAVQLLDDRLATSIVWGLLALGCLALSIRNRERLLGQSSLLIFAVSAGKVLLYDLHQAAPLIRIGILLVLGLTLYAGGWLYQRVLVIKAEPR